MTAYLNGLATTVPAHAIPQDLAKTTAARILGPRYESFERMSGAFENSGVERRYSVAPLDWFETPKVWPERNDLHVRGATELFVRTAAQALAKAGWSADSVDTVVTVSTTGIATPSIEARAWKAMGFRADLHRVPVFGLGCAGGVSGMAIARNMAVADPGSRVLLVSVETCTLSFRSDRLQKADIIATVLFGDGAAAACLSTAKGDADVPVVRVEAGRERIWPDTLGIMGWDVDEAGLGVVFDRSIPEFIRTRMGEAASWALGASDLARADIARFVCHPGGAKVVEALEAALGLTPGSLVEERSILRDFGNMSSPTVLFVLERVLAGGAEGRMIMSALGPGFTASFLPIRVGRFND